MLNFARRGAFPAVTAVALCATSASAQPCPDAAALTAGVAEPLATVRYLANDALRGRRAGSPGERCSERGVLLGGVTAESPGGRAGMQKGDILIQLGGHEIVDLQGFTDALAAHKPGDRVEIVVIRDGREVRLEALPGRRGG